MPGNTTPIFSKVGSIQFPAILATANTALDGTGTVSTVFTADATNGSYIQKLIVRANGANSAATALRIFINNGATNATATNNALIGELALPATSASNSVPMPGFEYPLNIILPPGYKINITLGAAPTSAGWTVTGIGGTY